MTSDEFQLLRGGSPSRPVHHRPPWAIAELPFFHLCDQCGDCIRACPEQILVRGRGGYPQIDFSRGGCSFCGECARACHQGGLLLADEHPWNLKVFIAESCLSNQGTECRACGERCQASAIQFRRQAGSTAMPMLEQALCNGCGACISKCPVYAINVLSCIQEGGLLS
ncbi:MAG: ferredoxin-type protein NapF [Pseudomonadota bacterium]|nr:ferredoxin-type protein NapF [Pseudomonadota bacterium]